MKCAACSSTGPFEDGFCTSCGLEQPASRLPVRREPDRLPALWREAAPVVVRGLALVAAGIAAEWLLRNGARSAAPRSIRPLQRKKQRSAAPGQAFIVEEVFAVQRTVMTRRVVGQTPLDNRVGRR